MNAFGRIFRVSIFGESHSSCIGVTVDGCPAGIDLTVDDFHSDLSRRNPNIIGVTARKENDTPQILTGTFNGKTTGAPITILFQNNDVNSAEYSANLVRPSHSDFVAKNKFNGFNDFRGSGMFSGRMTVGIVAAGVIAKKLIPDISINAAIISIGNINNNFLPNQIPKEILQLIESVVKSGDSLGGIIECTVKNIPIGIGEPFFDSLESVISHIIFSISGIKGIEFGAGFGIAKMLGSEANDCFIDSQGKTKTNNSGGINGGISNGNDLIFRVAARPTPSIQKVQNTFNFEKNQLEELSITGRYDTCFALRLPVIVEAATAIALADMLHCNMQF